MQLRPLFPHSGDPTVPLSDSFTSMLDGSEGSIRRATAIPCPASMTLFSMPIARARRDQTGTQAHAALLAQTAQAAGRGEVVA